MKLFTGLYTAIITPFKNGQIDENAFERLIEFQIKNNVNGIIPCGTTGESPTLNHDEHNKVIELACQIANNRINVIAGTGSNSTAEAIKLTNHAKKVGANGALIVVPYYNKPTQEGLYAHFKAINDNCDIPLIIYNIPGRSVVDMQDQTIANLAKLKNIIGIKDATGDLARVASLRLLVDDDFCFLSGEDATAVGFNAMGGDGVISVSSNIAPDLCKKLQNACENNDYPTALKIQDQLTPLHQLMFASTSPAPIKYAASLLGYGDGSIRLPLVEINDDLKQQIKSLIGN